MTEQELRHEALQTATFCRKKELEDECRYMQPGGPGYWACPMRPAQCKDVTASMWEDVLRDAFQLYGHIEEDA